MGNVHRLDRPAERLVNRQVSIGKAAAVSSGLSVLFLAIYGGCNWIASHRVGLGSLYFAWERNLPFVPWLIPAYLSLDIFFVGAPLLCLTDEELRTYTRRIAAAILIAGFCFLAFPLRYAFQRPEADGLVGLVFHWFHAMDAPHNLVPSLHAALLLLVADVYVRHLHGLVRAVAIGWFALIGISPVLTYQHHIVDIAAGFSLAACCFYFFPGRRSRYPTEKNHRVGFYYIAVAAVLAVAAVVIGGWGFLLLWPAAATAIVGSAYFGAGGGVYRKRNGRLPLSTRCVLAPCLLGQQLSRIFYRRECHAWDVVTPNVWIGSALSRAEAEKAVRGGVTAVLDLTAEFSQSHAFRLVEYRNIALLDLTAPSQAQLVEMAQFIAKHTATGIVYVHCKIGYSRSAAAVAAYLISVGKATEADAAFAIIRRVRPSIVIRPEAVSAVRRFSSEYRRPEVQQSFVLASAARALA